ncbi:cytochrome c [Maribacter vaceletii]|uniref:Cytochrome c n=1 Tax=Maribacter vaceletii TaxID=1206816 RepID=A0A495E5I7_9FLAO|nr:cytochrome c [Maribacter vaceletii]RKR12192.1 cytochrome c [Maribacter vaceletii]
MNFCNFLSLLILVFISFTAKAQNESSKLKESMSSGKDIYAANCVSCHMATGEGIIGAFPPLAKSDYLMEDVERSIKVIIEGATGEMKVNGQSYYGSMVGYNMLTDRQVADVLNYIRNSWGNKGDIVESEEVSKVRK